MESNARQTDREPFEAYKRVGASCWHKKGARLRRLPALSRDLAGGGWRRSENIRPQVVAGDGAVGGAFDLDASLNGDALPRAPLADRRRLDVERIRERGLTPNDLDGAVKCLHAPNSRLALAYRQ